MTGADDDHPREPDPDRDEQPVDGPPPPPGPRSAQILAGLVRVVGVLALVGVVVQAVDAIRSEGAEVPVVVTDVEAAVAGLPEDLPDGVTLEAPDDDVRVNLVVDTLPAGLRVGAVAGDLLTGVLLVVGAWLLAAVLRDIGAGRPFARTTPPRIRGLAGVVLVWALVPSSLGNAAAALVIRHLETPHTPLPLGFEIISLEVAPLLTAAVIAVVAAAFRHGQQLAEDTEGLV